MILIIDTTNSDYLKIYLAKSGQDFWVKKISAKFKQAEKLLKNIEKLLKDKKVKLKDLSGLGVVAGPGGFTAIRIGVVTANTLAYSLKIPVAGVKQGEFDGDEELVNKIFKKLKIKKGRFDISKNIILPFYDREPNIG